MPLHVYSDDWLAGLAEAEGCFDVDKGKYPRFRVEMNDSDVVNHFDTLIGRGVFPSVLKSRSRFRSGKSQYITTIVGARCGWRTRLVAMQIAQKLRQKRADVERVLGTTLPPTDYTPNLDWFVGFIEGEGTFAYSSANVLVDNTDLGALELAQKFFNVGTINPVKVEENRKPKWRWAVGSDDARNLMRTLYPMMSLRRQFQIEESLSSSRKLPISARPAYKYLVTNREGGDRIWTPMKEAA